MHQDWLRTEKLGIPSPYRSHHEAPGLRRWHKPSKSIVKDLTLKQIFINYTESTYIQA